MTVNTWGDALAWFLLGLCSGWMVVGVGGFLMLVYVLTWEGRGDAGEG